MSAYEYNSPVETQTQRETAYKEFSNRLIDKFFKNQSNKLVLGKNQTIHLKSIEGKPFYLEQPISKSGTRKEIKLIIEKPKLGYDYNVVEYQVLDNGTVIKESFCCRSKIEAKITNPKEDEESQIHYKQETCKRLEGIPPQPISLFEADKLITMINQSSVISN
jgi:hypothetical protein